MPKFPTAKQIEKYEEDSKDQCDEKCPDLSSCRIAQGTMDNASYIKACAEAIKVEKFMAKKKAKAAKLDAMAKDEKLDVKEPEETAKGDFSIAELEEEKEEVDESSEEVEDEELDMGLAEIDEIEADSEW